VKTTPIINLMCGAKLIPSNQIKRVTKYNSNKNKQQEVKGRMRTQEFVYQFGLMMTYFGGESSSQFHYNDMSFFTKIY